MQLFQSRGRCAREGKGRVEAEAELLRRARRLTVRYQALFLTASKQASKQSEVNVRPDVMLCSVAFEYLVFHAVNRRLGVFVSPVEKELAQSVCSCFMVNDWS